MAALVHPALPFSATGPLAGARRLAAANALAIVLVACLSIAGQLLVLHSLERRRSDTAIVSIADRQRVLSQRMAKTALVIQDAGPGERRAHAALELAALVRMWGQCHDGLQCGSVELGLPGDNSAAVHSMFADIQPEHYGMHCAAKDLVRIVRDDPRSSAAESRAAIQAHLDMILRHESSFLAGMDRIVHQFNREADQRAAHLRFWQQFLLVLTLLALAPPVAGAILPGMTRYARNLRRVWNIAKKPAECCIGR